jgi:hypothetical protein
LFIIVYVHELRGFSIFCTVVWSNRGLCDRPIPRLDGVLLCVFMCVCVRACARACVCVCHHVWSGAIVTLYICNE